MNAPTKKFKLNKRFKTQWVKALRSGEYTQGNGALFDSYKNTYCCLGVACAVAGIDPSIVDDQTFIDQTDLIQHTKTIYSKRAIKSFIKNACAYDDQGIQAKLAEFNDNSGLGFKWIASYIEENL